MRDDADQQHRTFLTRVAGAAMFLRAALTADLGFAERAMATGSADHVLGEGVEAARAVPLLARMARDARQSPDVHGRLAQIEALGLNPLDRTLARVYFATIRARHAWEAEDWLRLDRALTELELVDVALHMRLADETAIWLEDVRRIVAQADR